MCPKTNRHDEGESLPVVSKQEKIEMTRRGSTPRHFKKEIEKKHTMGGQRQQRWPIPPSRLVIVVTFVLAQDSR